MIELSTGANWLVTATRPIVASTAVIARRIGRLAATSAPNAINRIASVIGSEVTNARLKSLLIESLSCLLMLASPTCSTVKFGLAACAAAVAFSVAPTRLEAWSSSPAISKRSRAECPSAEIWPALAGL